MKTQPTTQSVPLVGYMAGFVVGLVVPIVLEWLVTRYIRWSIYFAVFTGLLGAILGGYVAAFRKPTGLERKQLTDSLFPKLCIIVGVIIAFWVPTILVFMSIARHNGENAVLGLIYGPCAGALVTPLGAMAGKYLAQSLMNVGSEEDNSQ